MPKTSHTMMLAMVALIAFVSVPILAATDSTPMCPPRIASEPNTDTYCISNDYFFVSGSQGILDTLRFDPNGKGVYGPNLIVAMQVKGAEAGPVRWESDSGSLAISNISVISQMLVPGMSASVPGERADRLTSGRTLGQSFRADQPFNRVGGSFPTWNTATSGLTLTLRREGPTGPAIATQRFTNIVDNGWLFLETDAQPPGNYHLEISDPVGTVGWWTATRDVYSDGSAYNNGVPEAMVDRTLQFELLSDVARTGTLNIQLAGNRLTMRFVASIRQLGGQLDAFEMVTPWEKTGYDVTDPHKTPFVSFQNTEGRYLPIEQFKRNDGWELGAPPIYATGQNGYDLEFGGLYAGIDWAMDDDRMVYTFRPSDLGTNRLVITVLEPTGRIPEYFPVFYSSDPEFDQLLNRFYYERAYSYPGGSLSDWYEWTGLIHSWVNHPHRTLFKNSLLGAMQDPDGYVWTFGPNRGWPFPEPALYDTRHFTPNALLIMGSYRYYTWTGDEAFLNQMMPKLRAAMAFQLEELGGKDGLLVLPGPHHHGRNGDLGSNYWDILPFGHLSAYENIYFYASLRALAELEQVTGDLQAAERYMQLSEVTRDRYNAAFWDDEAGRYIGTIDVDGVAHDYGFTFLNMEAMAYGLATAEQARRIYHWMEHEPTSSGEADTYTRWIFAPRSTTIHNPKGPDGWWFAGWQGSPYGDQVQDGGAILYTSYYDIVARTRLIGTESAWQRFSEIMERYSMPDKLSGGSPLYLGEIPQNEEPGQVGTDWPFPESGLVPSSVLYAFIGLDASVDGLKIDPLVPEHFEYLGVRNVSYRGWSLDIRVTNESVRVEGKRRGDTFVVEEELAGRPWVLDAAFPEIRQ